MEKDGTLIPSGSTKNMGGHPFTYSLWSTVKNVSCYDTKFVINGESSGPFYII